MKNILFYQSANLSDEQIISQFVVRKKEFDRIISEIRRDKMAESIQHYILIGNRGSGKSTLLRRIQAEINTDSDLSSRLVVVNLSEEQAGIYRLHDLWERILRELQYNKFEVNEPDWNEYGKEMIHYSKRLYHEIQNTLRRQDKKLVVLLDNIDRIFETLNEQETHLLRELLTNYKDIRIIGGSTRLSEHHWKYDKPFYEFFKPLFLQSLSETEFKELLLFWSERMNAQSLKVFVESSPGKLNMIRILTDGMPRTILNFVELLISKPDESGYDYLMQIMDKATPIYQERLGKLSPAKQKIVIELSFFWEAVKVKPLTQAVKMENKNVSALLNQLVEDKIVEKIKGKGKNLLYRLKERFFNLWLIVTQGGPKQKREFKGLTVFLENFYEAGELKEIYGEFKKKLSDGKISPDQGVVMTKALVHSKIFTIDERDDLLDTFLKLPSLNKEILDLLPQKGRDIMTNSVDLMNKGSFENAIEELQKIDQDFGYKMWWLGTCFYSLKKYSEAEKYYRKAIEIGDIVDGKAEGFLGLTYFVRGKFELAEKYFLLSIKKGDTISKYPLATIFYRQNREPEKAFELITQVLGINGMEPNFCFYQTVISIWSGNFEYIASKRNIVLQVLQNGENDSITSFLSQLLMHNQVNLVWSWFHDPALSEKFMENFKPIYYATAHLLKNDEIILAQPPELNETVENILAYIKDRQEFYYGNKKD